MPNHSFKPTALRLVAALANLFIIPKLFSLDARGQSLADS